MLDIKFVREHAVLVKESELKRNRDASQVDEVFQWDEQWKKELKHAEELKHRRNVVSEEINQAKKAKKEDLAESKITEMKSVAEDIRRSEEKAKACLEERNVVLKKIGNILDKAVPKGKDETENQVIKTAGKLPQFNFPVKDHQELAEELELIELDTASKVSGARFYYLKNEAVILHLALQRFAVDVLLKHGFQMVFPPFMLNRAALEGGVNLSEFQDTIYKIEGEDLYLIGTSEHPLVALRQDQILRENELPLRLGGISTCFRKEAGAHGRDTKGIFRVHQFDKVEQVIYCKPEDSARLFQETQSISEDIFRQLGLPFRVMMLCSGDLGNKQSLQYDIEAWFPGQNEKKGAYREVTSCSNCLDYQAVTLNTRFIRADGRKEHVHMLNNTGLASPRALAAVLENYQTAEGTVKIPKVLWPYMSGIKEIRKKKWRCRDLNSRVEPSRDFHVTQ